MMLVQHTIDSLIGSSGTYNCKCIGFKLTEEPCTNPTALKNVLKASRYTEAASLLHCSTPEGRTDLHWLAGLLLCKRNHRKHSFEVMETWQNQARQCLATDKTACTRKRKEKQYARSKDTISVEKDESDLKPRDISDGGERAGKVKTNVQTRSMTARASRRSSEAIDLDFQPREASDDQERTGKTMTNVQTRSMTSRTSRTRPDRAESPPEFIEHGKSKRTLSAINAEVMKHILNVLKPNRRLSEHDLKPGYIYAFTRASSPGYVKIGLTKRAVDVRLVEWERKCKYSPHQATPKNARKIPYAAQIERLILADLAVHRRKESVCNGGAGCRTIHHEWVEVDLELALEVIDRWCSWAEKRPYDENGVLCDEWEAHTKVPVRAASSKEREQGTRWQEWIDCFPTGSRLSSANELSPISATGNASYRSIVEKGSPPLKLRWSASEIQAMVKPLALKPRTDSFVPSRSLALVAGA